MQPRACCTSNLILNHVKPLGPEDEFAYLICDADVSLLRSHSFKPRSHKRKPSQVETSFVGNMRIRVERNVGDGVLISDEELTGRQVTLHYAESIVTSIHFFR